MSQRTSLRDIRRMKRKGELIAMLTAYDYPTAYLLDQAGVPMLLVGDSLGMTVLGHETTVPVTLDGILHHTQAVARGAENALIVADLPFLTYNVNPDEALRNAGRLIQEGGAQAVKLEGGRKLAGTVERMVEAGIPVMGHLGLTPQSVLQFGGYTVQARTADAIRDLFEDARALQDAGIFALVLEVVPATVAEALTQSLDVPTIGIGAGAGCDGQVQVLSDILNLIPGPVPKHAKPYAEIGSAIQDAARRYRSDVEARSFPTDEQSFSLPDRVDLDEVLSSLREDGIAK
jgi:3-methyl-2-oxobutanoate hydroxymethyltransferase